MTDMDKGLERIEKGEAWHDTDEVVEVEVKRPLDKVIPVRLSAEDWAKLKQEARELGVGPTTLARMWILDYLRLLHRKFLTESASLRSELSLLTPRELEILSYIAQGYLTKQIAEELGINTNTIRSHIEDIRRKLGDQAFVQYKVRTGQSLI